MLINSKNFIKKSKTMTWEQRYIVRNAWKLLLQINLKSFDDEFKKNDLELYFECNSSRDVFKNFKYVDYIN